MRKLHQGEKSRIGHCSPRHESEGKTGHNTMENQLQMLSVRQKYARSVRTAVCRVMVKMDPRASLYMQETARARNHTEHSDQRGASPTELQSRQGRRMPVTFGSWRVNIKAFSLCQAGLLDSLRVSTLWMPRCRVLWGFSPEVTKFSAGTSLSLASLLSPNTIC